MLETRGGIDKLATKVGRIDAPSGKLFAGSIERNPATLYVAQ